MNLAAAAPVWILAILFGLLLAAAVEDAVRLRISNLTSAGVLLAAVLAALLTGISPALWQNGAVFAVLLAAGTLVFATGQMGGGDVKLLAAVGLWFNIQSALALLVAVFLCGGLLALGYVAVRLARGKGLKRRAQQGGIPYGVAIAAGALMIFARQLQLI
jgi:prepilin peptidase CpaA